jgi:ABC-type nitrate/sulfonate/bicarbonate transport system substrate-binding protein
MQKAKGSYKLIIAALVWHLLAGSVPSEAQDKSAPEKVRIAIATGSLAFMVPFVAKDRGFYLKHGSDVELIQMRPNISVAALLSGEIHYIELIGSAIRSAARGLPVRAISTGIKAPFFSIIGQN